MMLAKLEQEWYYSRMSELGRRLAELRKSQRLTLREAALRAGVSNAYLSQIESGARPTPHPNILRRLAPVYEVPVRELLEAAGYLDEPEISGGEDEQVNRAFEFVMADARFQAGTRVKEGLSIEAKRYIIEVYENVTGAKLLGLK